MSKADHYYENLSAALEERILEEKRTGTFADYSCKDSEAVRRNAEKDRPTVWRPAFTRDAEKILHSPFYNRYTDKTQVFSFHKNDDITRRALHVQIVSRIARTIGEALHLNLNLIEAIAIGHDIGHTPFGHAGEKYLNELYSANTGRCFLHNLHSARVLDGIFHCNLTLQTLSGIVSHNGECELQEYRPRRLSGFAEYDEQLERASVDAAFSAHLVPNTMEGCVVRVCDMIAYLGKDRQDAERANLKIVTADDSRYFNASIINNLVVNIIENSYGKPYVAMDEEHFDTLKRIKSDNYELIYQSPQVRDALDKQIRPMFEMVYTRLLSDLREGRADSPIFTHHIAFVENTRYRKNEHAPYREQEYNRIVTDYIASMTDDYFLDLFAYLFPESSYRVAYKGYFDLNEEA